MELLLASAGIGWEPEIRGFLSVLVGVVVLCGSVYLLLATNTGARLGMLLALGGVFGLLSILSLYWWIDPPGIGPVGDDPFWKPEEIHAIALEDPEQFPPRNEDAQRLPRPDERPDVDEILADHPELAAELPPSPTLSDIEGADPELLATDDFGGWRVVPTADAGDAQTDADEVLVEQGLFQSADEFEHLGVFAIGGKPTRQERCDDDDLLCRAWHRVRIVFMTHPTHYTAVEVQPTVPQVTIPGEPPPRPVLDETQPTYWVIMERQLGTTRVLPATYFLVSFALFIAFCLILHYRDKTLEQNLETAKAVAKAEA